MSAKQATYWENQINPWTGRIEKSLSPRFASFRPICSLCKTPVNRFTDSYDANTRQFQFLFECHGREETLPIDQQTVDVYPDYLKKYLSNYQPFARDAAAMTTASFIPKGAPVVRAPGGGIRPKSDRPSPAFAEFMQQILNDLAGNIGLPADALFTTEYVPETKPLTKSQPKVEDFLLPARKPRVITLEN